MPDNRNFARAFASLTEISLQSGVTLDIEGDGATINGQGNQRGLFVNAGNVTIENLTVINAVALGASGQGEYIAWGGAVVVMAAAPGSAAAFSSALARASVRRSLDGAPVGGCGKPIGAPQAA